MPGWCGQRRCRRGTVWKPSLHLAVLRSSWDQLRVLRHISSAMSVRLSVLLLALAAVAVLGQRKRPAAEEWNYRDGADKVNLRGVANLTQVLDNWRFDILAQMRNLLQNDHQSLLPDYARIQPLSEALDDLFKEFNALKTHLGDLSEKVVAVEAFVDQAKAERVANTGAAAAAKRKTIKKKVPES